MVNTPNQSTKFRTKKWVEINDESRGTYNTNSQIKSKKIKSNFCDQTDIYIAVEGPITVANIGTATPNNRNKEEVYKNCTSLMWTLM